MWNESTKARRLHHFITNISEIPKHFKPTPGMVHFLTGHGPYPSYLRRFNLSETEMCQCGEEGTPEHIVVQCGQFPDTENRRERLQNYTIKQIIENEELFDILNHLTQKVSRHQMEIYNEQRNNNR